MTQQNPLFQEIEEDLDRQRMEALWKRYGVWLIAAAVAVVVTTAGFTAWQSWRGEQQIKATDALMTIMDNSSADTGKQIEALEAFAGKNHGETQATLARFDAAGIAAKADDAKKAIALYDEIANDAKADPAFRQLADLFAVRAQMDSGDPVTLQNRLQPLLADNAPWRYSAMEAEGFLALRTGDKTKARQVFTELAQDAGAPSTIAARAGDMVRFVGE